MIKALLQIWILIFVTTGLHAKENSRPDSVGGDYLIELNAGFVFEEREEIFELGFDFERFVDSTNHHCSLGLATEFEFMDHRDEVYIGPLFSFYYFHFKSFVTTGVLTDFSEHNDWKSRVGVGYEIFLSSDLLVVPTVALDYVRQHFDMATSLGVAYEF